VRRAAEHRTTAPFDTRGVGGPAANSAADTTESARKIETKSAKGSRKIIANTGADAEIGAVHQHGEGAHLKSAADANRASRVSGRNLLALGLLYATFGSSWAATPIYKCFDKKFDVVYTDLPCKDGAPLDVRAGDADPVAVARLERARDALDQSAAQRISDMRWASAQRTFAPPWYGGPNGPGWADDAVDTPYDYGAIWGFPGSVIGGFGNGWPPYKRPHGAFKARNFAFSSPNMGNRR
jgi:hypothetical protein